MANQNHYALLVDDENDDPSALFERAGAVSRTTAPSKEIKKTARPVAKLPTKPTPPAQAVKESQNESSRGRGRGRSGGRGTYQSRDSRFTEGFSSREGAFQGSEQSYGSSAGSRGGFRNPNSSFNGEASIGLDESGRSNDIGGGRGRGRSRGRGRGDGNVEEGEERPKQREYDRRSGTGRGNELKREGSGRGNWGAEIDLQSSLDNAGLLGDEEKPSSSPKIAGKESEDARGGVDAEKEEEEDKEMTLDEYERVLSEKRKSLEALKAKERKVTVDDEFASMKLVEKKSEDIFLKLGGADKGKKKDTSEKDERAKKPLNINKFLRPVEGEGEGYFSPSSRRGRGSRGRGERGSFRGGFGASKAMAPSIEDPSHFPTLSGK